MKTRVPVLVAMLATLSVSAQADETFRCGQWVISSDLTVEELVKKCGPPTTEESRTEDIKARNHGLLIKNGETTTTTWTFDRGTQAAPMVVTIVDGRIKIIERKK
jgi:hypothetical protein